MATVRCDGLYRGQPTPLHDGNVTCSYLRFYTDGTAVDVSSIGTAEQVANWIARDRGYTQGQYKLAGAELTIAVRLEQCEGERCMLHYRGTVLENGLALRWTSEKTGNSGAGQFEFVRVDFKS